MIRTAPSPTCPEGTRSPAERERVDSERGVGCSTNAALPGTPLPLTGEGAGAAPPSLYDRFAALYAEYRLHVFPDDRAEIAAALDLSGARHLLEPGCGPGFYATAFAAAYPDLRVTGIDRAPAQVAIARRRTIAEGLTNACFLVGNAQQIEAPPGSFDRIVASRLLMVVDEPAAVLAEFRRMLAPGGILLLAEPVRPRFAVLAVLRRAAHARGGTERYIEPLAERHFTADAFRALVMTQAWASVAIWNANGYYYARCRTCASVDCSTRRTCP